MTYIVRIINRFMSEHRALHFLTAKRFIRFIKRTLGYGVLFLANLSQLSWTKLASQMQTNMEINKTRKAMYATC